MTAPSRARTASRTTTTEREPATKTTKTTRSRGTARTRSAAAERAYARREERRALRENADRTRKQRSAAPPEPKPVRRKAKQPQSKTVTSRVPLVMTGMALLAGGLVATLWLSIAAVSGSYQIQQGELELANLTEQKEKLIRQNSVLDSTQSLLRHAEKLGLRPSSEPAYLVRNPDGSTRLIGDPRPTPPSESESTPPPAEEAR